MNLKTFLLALLATSTLLGCARGNTTINNALSSTNKKFESEFSSVRYVTKPYGERSTISTLEWAGSPGESAADNATVLKQDILNDVFKACGHKANQLKETRIVQQSGRQSYEVWVFDDPLSERDDHTSALSIVMTQLPNDGGVDFRTLGVCHAKKPLKIESTY